MAPAHQRLAAMQLALGGDDRLIGEFQLVQEDRRAQLALDIAGVLLVPEHLVFEQGRLGTAVPLALVEREVGILHQLVEQAGVARAEGDADRGREVQRSAGMIAGVVERDQEALGQPGGRFGRGAFDQKREFVAADPADEAAGEDASGDRRQMTQSGIAHVVPVGVVDLLEIIHVDEEQRVAAGCGRDLELRSATGDEDPAGQCPGDAVALVDQRILAVRGVLLANQLGLKAMLPACPEQSDDGDRSRRCENPCVPEILAAGAGEPQNGQADDGEKPTHHRIMADPHHGARVAKTGQFITLTVASATLCGTNS